MTIETRALLLRRNWLPPLACTILFVGGSLAARIGADELRLAGYFTAWFGLVFTPALLLRNAFPRATPVVVRASPEGLAVEGGPAVPGEDILEVKMLPRAGLDAVVELAVRGTKKTISLRARKQDAQALVDVLGARRARFRLMSSYGKRLVATYALFLASHYVLSEGHLRLFVGAMPALLLLATLVAGVLGMLRGRLVVGADGFTTRWLWERFIPFADVERVTSRPRLTNAAVVDTVVELRSGRKIRLRSVEVPNTEEERGAESRAMFASMRAAFDAARLEQRTVDVPSLLQRGSRSARDWLSGIDALVRGGGSRYRVAAVSADMLTTLTSDPNASAESRVGAAAALVRLGDDTQRARIRIAAETCADSSLRDALLALAEAHDEAATEAALASFRRGSS